MKHRPGFGYLSVCKNAMFVGVHRYMEAETSGHNFAPVVSRPGPYVIKLFAVVIYDCL